MLYTVVACIVTVFAYGRNLTLPLFFDDLVQLPFVDRYSLFQHWTGSFESPYYRPLTITVFKLMAMPFDQHSAPLLHGLNLILHALNGALAGLLGALLWERFDKQTEAQPSILFGIVTTVLYILFPFHYQAIPWVAALFHLLVTTVVLAALLAYLRGWFFLTIVFAFLAPFAHENGVVVVPTIFLIELLLPQGQKSDGQPKITRLAILLAPVGIWLLIRSLVSTGRDGSTLFPGLESVGQSLSFFVQGLGWPGAIFGRHLLRFDLLNDLEIVWITAGGAIILALMAAFYAREKLGGKMRLPLFGLGFWLLAAAPASAILPFSYNVNGPRLLTLAAVGVSLFWAAALVACVSRLRLNLKYSWAILAVVLFLAAQGASVLHVEQSNHLHTLLGDAVVQAADISVELDQDESYPVFVNFPSSLAPAEKRFVLGNEGVVFWPEYAPPHTLMSANGPIQQTDQVFVQVDAIRQEPPYLHGIVAPTHTVSAVRADLNAIFYNSVYSENEINLFPIGHVKPSPKQTRLGKPPLTEDQFEIQMIELGMVEKTIGETLFTSLVFEWDMYGEVPETVTVFVHAVSPNGEILQQADGDPMAGLYPLSQVESDKRLVDIRHVTAHPTIAFFRVGLYDRVTGERVPLFDRDGERLDEDMAILPVNLLQPND